MIGASDRTKSGSTATKSKHAPHSHSFAIKIEIARIQANTHRRGSRCVSLDTSICVTQHVALSSRISMIMKPPTTVGDGEIYCYIELAPVCFDA